MYFNFVYRLNGALALDKDQCIYLQEITMLGIQISNSQVIPMSRNLMRWNSSQPDRTLDTERRVARHLLLPVSSGRPKCTANTSKY